MKVDGKHFRSIWLEPDGWSVSAIDQRRLPHEFVVAQLTDLRSRGRGDPLHAGARRAADRRHRAYGMALAMRADGSDAALDRAYADC